MSKGIDKVKDLIDKANDVLVKGKAIVKDSETVWTDIQEVLKKGMESYDSAVESYETFEKKWGKGDIGSKITASIEATQEIKVIIEEVNGLKDKVFEIYDKIKVVKDNTLEIFDALRYILAELKKWRQIKREIEEQLNEAKLEIIKAVATCKKLATKKYQGAKAELDDLVNYLGTLDLKTINSALKDQVTDRFKDVMSNYDWFTSGGESQIKDLKKAVKKGVTDNLTHLLDDALSYAERSQSWQRIEGLEQSMNELQSTLDSLINDKADKEVEKSKFLSKSIKKLADKLIASAGDKASEVLGDLIKPVGPAFELVGNFLKAYNLASGVIATVENFPESLEQELPKTFSKDFVNWKDTLFEYGGAFPIASLGWISLIAEFGIKSEAEFQLSGSVTFYNVFKPEELKILDGTLTASGQISLTGSASLGVNLLGIAEAKATASLTAAVMVKDTEAKLNILRKLSGEAKQGAFKLAGKSTLAFELIGSLAFSVGLTPVLRSLVRFATGKDPIATWKLGEMSLFTAETTKSFSAMLKFEAVEFNFAKVMDLLRDPSTYRLSAAGRRGIEQSVSDRLGRREAWEQYAGEGQLTEDEINQLREEYITTE